MWHFGATWSQGRGGNADVTFIPDLNERVYYPAKQDVERVVRAIGWLGDSVPRTGSIPSLVLEALKYFRKAHRREDTLLGWHTCEICGLDEFNEGRGEFFIDVNGVRYVMPQMLIHYIEAHSYRPPGAFVEKLEAFWKQRRDEELKRNPDWNCVLSEDQRILEHIDDV